MRLTAILLLICCIGTRSTAAETRAIQPGMDIAKAKAILAEHGCKLDPCQLAIVIRDGWAVECGPIDSETMLLVTYKKETQQVTSLEVQFIPGGRAPKLSRVSREASKIGFEEDGAVTLTFKRVQRHREKAVEERPENPFDF